MISGLHYTDQWAMACGFHTTDIGLPINNKYFYIFRVQFSHIDFEITEIRGGARHFLDSTLTLWHAACMIAVRTYLMNTSCTQVTRLAVTAVVVARLGSAH